jgi:hypothetical protein
MKQIFKRNELDNECLAVLVFRETTNNQRTCYDNSLPSINVPIIITFDSEDELKEWVLSHGHVSYQVVRINLVNCKIQIEFN